MTIVAGSIVGPTFGSNIRSVGRVNGGLLVKYSRAGWVRLAGILVVVSVTLFGVWQWGLPWILMSMARDLTREEIQKLIDDEEYLPAVYSAKKAGMLHPENPAFLLLLGEAYEKSGQKTRALEAYRRACRDFSSLAEPFFFEARMLYKMNRIDEALGEHEKSAQLAIKNNNPEILLENYVSLADIQGGFFKRYLQAAAYYEKALVLEPDNLTLHYQAGVMCAYAGRPTQAFRHFNFVIQKKPGSELAREAENAIMYVREGRKPNIARTPIMYL